jgi:ribosomal protein L37AE/L43A
MPSTPAAVSNLPPWLALFGVGGGGESGRREESRREIRGRRETVRTSLLAAHDVTWTVLCAVCGKDAVKRNATGIWECKACRKVVAGGAYVMNTVCQFYTLKPKPEPGVAYVMNPVPNEV